MVDFTPYINVLATDRDMEFLNKVKIFSSAYDVLWRYYDAYDVIVTRQTGNGGGVIYPRWFLQNST